MMLRKSLPPEEVETIRRRSYGAYLASSPWLYLGGKDGAASTKLLNEAGITHIIINCAPAQVRRNAEVIKAQYLELHMDDHFSCLEKSTERQYWTSQETGDS